jgi:hypothetical protein
VNTLETARHLTKNIRAVDTKPHLRSVLEAELLKLGHSPEDVQESLNALFKVTVH